MEYIWNYQESFCCLRHGRQDLLSILKAVLLLCVFAQRLDLSYSGVSHAMAFSFNPQLLIHEGELNEILAVIKSKGSEVKIVGALFGLWRNSLKQPVVHLVTGPGKKAGIQKDKFSTDFSYVNGCKEYLRRNHGLLQIGLWCSGSIRRYPKREYTHLRSIISAAALLLLSYV